MKEIIAEYPLVVAEDTPDLALFRFPFNTKRLIPTDVRYKPLSKYVEVVTPLPSSNVSAVRSKLLAVEQLSYKSIGTPLANHYSTAIIDGKLILRKIGTNYLFEAMHQSYATSTQGSVIKKAESREELEHRKRSINYKLKCMNIEDFRLLKYEDQSAQNKNNLVPNLPDQIDPSTNAEIGGIVETAAVSNTDTKKSNNALVPHSKIEDVVKKARVANYADIVAIFRCENAVKNIFYKMTEKIAGRFILKNLHYEKRLWDSRTKLLELLEAGNGTVSLASVQFLGNEIWMAKELTEQTADKLTLKGYAESTSFDLSVIEASNKSVISEIMRDNRMLSIPDISRLSGLDTELVQQFVDTPTCLHLANNAYAYNNASYWFNSVLQAYTGRKVLTLPDIKSILSENSISKEDDEILSELKHYSNQRGGKYFLKIIK